MLTEEQAAIAYEEATDGCRRSVLGTRDNARQWQRVKPDESCILWRNSTGRRSRGGTSHWSQLLNPIYALGAPTASRW